MMTVEFLLVVFSLLIIAMFLFARFWRHEYKEALKDKNKWQNKYWRVENELIEAQLMAHRAWKQNAQLHHKINKMTSEYSNRSFTIDTIDKDLLDAVKKGMMAAHPDHGGNQEDFIRFHKKYNELRNRS